MGLVKDRTPFTSMLKRPNSRVNLDKAIMRRQFDKGQKTEDKGFRTLDPGGAI